MSSESNFPQTGGPRSMTETMRSARALIQKQPTRDSSTTTTRDEAETRNALSLAGQSAIGFGATPMPSDARRVCRAFALPEVATARLPRLLAPLLVWGEASVFGDHGFEGVSVTSVAVRPSASRDDLTAAYADILAVCEPCQPNIAAGKLAELRSMTVTRKRDDVDMDVAAAAYTSRLAQYPTDVVVAACDAWADREEFWPSWAELKFECDKRFRGRRQIRDALEQAIRG